MKPRLFLVAWLALVLPPLLCSAPAPEKKPDRPEDSPRQDAHGDPLPDGAFARLGTARLRHGGRITGLAFSPDGKTLASSSRDGTTIRLWDATTGREIRQFQQEEAGIYSVAFSSDGKLLAGSGRGTLWEIATGKPRPFPHRQVF